MLLPRILHLLWLLVVLYLHQIPWQSMQLHILLSSVMRPDEDGLMRVLTQCWIDEEEQMMRQVGASVVGSDIWRVDDGNEYREKYRMPTTSLLSRTKMGQQDSWETYQLPQHTKGNGLVSTLVDHLRLPASHEDEW